MDELRLTDAERALAGDYMRFRAMGRTQKLRHPWFAFRTPRRYQRANPFPTGRFADGRRLGDLGRYISAEFYGFTVGKFAYRYEQFWYRGVNLESVGAFTSLALNITITGVNHPLTHVTTSPIVYLASRGFASVDQPGRMAPERNEKVRIGNDVWIGDNVTILPGVAIGDGAVVGAGSVVTKDVLPYAIAAGNPARSLRQRFDDETILRLLALQWWDWDDEVIRERIDLFADPARFVAEFSS